MSLLHHDISTKDLAVYVDFSLLLMLFVIFRDKMARVPKLFNELWEVMGETGETIRESILWLVETVNTWECCLFML